MGLKGYRLWVMGQLDSTCRAPPFAVQLRRILQLRAAAAGAHAYAVLGRHVHRLGRAPAVALPKNPTGFPRRSAAGLHLKGKL
jgi:hypothetical protein